MTKFLVQAIIEGNNDISKEVDAKNHEDAIDTAFIRRQGADMIIFLDGYKREFIPKAKIIKFVVIDLDAKKIVDDKNAKETAEALGKLFR